jgi:hypothetical protein
MLSTIGRATHSTTQSGLSGISASEGTQGRPNKVWYFGLIVGQRALPERTPRFRSADNGDRSGVDETLKVVRTVERPR